MSITSLVLVMVIVTFSIRAFSVLLFSGRTLSPIFMQALSMVPVAILSAICGPLIFLPDNVWTNPILSVEFWSAVSCVLLARYGMVPAIVVGMGVYTLGNVFFI